MKRINLIIVDIPKDLKSLNLVLKYVGDETWDKFNKKEWIDTNDVKYIFFDKTRNDYSYTNYEQDYKSEFFKRKNLIQLNFKDIL